MPHDEHFLQRLDRVTREQTELALSLYQDHEALAWLLERITLPPEATRVALSLADSTEGPFVIVTRDGHFVTCLGKGMSPAPHPVVARGQIDAHLAKLADHRGRVAFARRERRPGEDQEDLLTRLTTRGERMSREDFVAVSSFEPLMGTVFWQSLVDAAQTLVSTRGKLANRPAFRAREERGLRGFHNLEWITAHLMLLCTMGDRGAMDRIVESGGSISMLCAMQRGHTFSLRGAWAAARAGKGALAIYKQSLASGLSQLEMLDGALGVGAIGLRHASATAEARKILARQVSLGPPEETLESNPANLPAALRALYARAALEAVEDPEKYLQSSLEVGRNLVFQRKEGLAASGRVFEREEDVPDDLARTALLSYDGDPLDVNGSIVALTALPMVVRAVPEDFYWPRALLRPMLGDYDVQQTLERLGRYRDPTKPKTTVRKTADVGRNDPCPCGSGKKFKKCCYGARAPA